MAAEKFVVRLLDSDRELVGWTEVWIQGRQGQFLAPNGKTTIIAERAAVIDHVTVHWTDLDVARVQPLAEPVNVALLQPFEIHWPGGLVWLVLNDPLAAKPATSTRGPVVISPPPVGVQVIDPRAVEIGDVR